MPTALDELFVDFGYRVDTRGLDTADKRLSQTLAGVGRVARRVTAIMGGALVALGGLSVNVAANFEDALNKSTAIAADVDAAMKQRLAQTAREVAKQTTFSAAEAAEAYFFLFSAGMSAEQALAALPRVAQFAQAGNFSLAQATDLLTDAQSALGLTVDDTTQNMANQSRLADVLVKANTLANATVEQFSTSLTRQFGGALKAYNKDVTEGVAVLAAYADQGVKGSEAGTRLTAVTLDLVDVARKNEAAFKRHNVQIFNSEGNLRNYADIIASFEQALDGVSSKQQTVILGELGIQKEAQATLLQLLGSSGAVREYERQLQDAGGTTDQIASNQLRSFRSQLSLLRSVVLDAAIGLGDRLLPHLTSLVTYLRENSAVALKFVAVLGLLALMFGVLAASFVFLATIGQILSATGGLVSFFLLLSRLAWMAGVRLPIRLLAAGAGLIGLDVTAKGVAGGGLLSLLRLIRLLGFAVLHPIKTLQFLAAIVLSPLGAVLGAVALAVGVVAAIILVFGNRGDEARAMLERWKDAIPDWLIGVEGMLDVLIWLVDRLTDLRDLLRELTGSGIGRLFSGLFAGPTVAAPSYEVFRPDYLGDAPIDEFASGGIVPGRGPRPALVHGGEAVLPPALTNALLGFVAGPPPPPAAAFASGGSVADNRSFVFTEGAIQVVAAPGQSPEDVGRATVDEFERHVDDLTHAFDSDILR